MHDDVSVNTGFFDQLQDNKDSAGSHAYHELAEAALKLQNKNPRCHFDTNMTFEKNPRAANGF